MKIRGRDDHGSGKYRAGRTYGLHNGVDICCDKGDSIKALSSGTVTKIGYPYPQGPKENRDKKALR